MPAPGGAAGTSLTELVYSRERILHAVMVLQNYWARRSELMSSQPLLPKRVAALLAAGIAMPARSQLPTAGNTIATRLHDGTRQPPLHLSALPIIVGLADRSRGLEP